MGLVARVLEREGLVTVSLTSAIDITERIRPPRAAFLDFPLGNCTGAPHDADGQRAILRDTLRLAETATEPGAIVALPYRWPDPDWERKTIQAYRDEADVVLDARLKTEYVDGVDTATAACKEVCSLA